MNKPKINPSSNAHEGTSYPKTSDETNLEYGDPTDGRKVYEWEAHYPSIARKEIRIEQCFLFFVFFSSLFLLFATWKGWIGSFLFLSAEEYFIIKKYAYYSFSGLLGGITFGMKYFYRVVARGRWHQDRRAWRIMSPFIAMTIALMIGMLFNSTIESEQKPTNTASILLFGFLAGYFADEAVSKMYEIANVIFGRSAFTKVGDGTKN